MRRAIEIKVFKTTLVIAAIAMISLLVAIYQKGEQYGESYLCKELSREIQSNPSPVLQAN